MTGLDAALVGKADQATVESLSKALAAKAEQSAVEAALASKANRADLDAANEGLATKADAVHGHFYGNPALMLYDVISAYFEGEQNTLGEYGYHRD